jgi:hypothetical protein
MALIDYATEVLADGPIGYWRLGEAPGSTSAADSSPSVIKNDGKYSGGITLGLPGFHGGDTAALFDGKTGRIVVPNSDSLNPAHITMEAKIRWDGPTPIQQQRILEKSSFAELAQYGLSVLLPDGHVQVELRTSSAATSIDVKSIGVAARGAETHVVATYDGRVIRIYLNGVLDSEMAAPGSISPKPPTAANLTESGVGIGNQTQRDRPFNGLIDEVALYATALSAARILAHYESQFAKPMTFQYAAKFVCGKSAGKVVAPGVYFTAVNVHNPTYRAIRFRMKIAVALPGLKPGPVSKFVDAKLGPDEALEIDCPDIHKIAETKADFLKGFVVIESGVELDVVAVYTAAGGDGQVETLHTERVPARRLELGRPDLIPVPDANGSFCKRKDSMLTVTVKNQGTSGAGSSVTEVDFLGFPPKVSMPTPPLAPGASVDLFFPIPPGSFNPDCEFRITVDANNQVNESNEGNNIANGRCLG